MGLHRGQDPPARGRLSRPDHAASTSVGAGALAGDGDGRWKQSKAKRARANCEAKPPPPPPPSLSSPPLPSPPLRLPHREKGEPKKKKSNTHGRTQRNACSTRRDALQIRRRSHLPWAAARASQRSAEAERGAAGRIRPGRGGGEANLAGAAVGLRARGRAGGWADGAEEGGGEDCGRLRPWRRRLLASMALSWPSAVRLLVAAVLLAGVGVALFTLPVEKVRAALIPSPPSPRSDEWASCGIRCLPAVSGDWGWQPPSCVRSSWGAHLLICTACVVSRLIAEM
jgi:hypothetical protein